jgi:hypothetical protein
MVNLEGQGVPGVFVASSVFEDGARTQGKALGLHPEAVYVPHPIQDRNDDEMLAIADHAFEAILAKLVEASD